MRCLAISARLAEISTELQARLSLSEQTLIRLSDELTALKQELAELKAKLAGSVTLSETLQAALAKTESSLRNSEQSFYQYRIGAEQEITRAYGQARFWRYAGIVGLVVGGAGIGFGIFLSGR
jgi:septal ring factor EnvC (AmiA/AmiB activator)